MMHGIVMTVGFSLTFIVFDVDGTVKNHLPFSLSRYHQVIIAIGHYKLSICSIQFVFYEEEGCLAFRGDRDAIAETRHDSTIAILLQKLKRHFITHHRDNLTYSWSPRSVMEMA